MRHDDELRHDDANFGLGMFTYWQNHWKDPLRASHSAYRHYAG